MFDKRPIRATVIEHSILRRINLFPAFSFKLDRRRKNILLVAGALLALIAFVAITFVNYR